MKKSYRVKSVLLPLGVWLFGSIFWMIQGQAPLQAQQLEWAYSFRNPLVLEEITSGATNGKNRFALIGMGNQGICMDPIQLNPVYNSPGSFVASYDAQAIIQWIYPVVDQAFSVGVMADGSVVVIGKFSGTKDFDPSGNIFNLTATGSEVYVQKFMSDGSFAWASSASIDGFPSHLELLSDGRVVLAGRSDGDATVSVGVNTVQLPKGLFILEFGAGGVLQQAKSVSVPIATHYIYLHDITSDATGNLYLAGSLDGVADFDPGTAGAMNTLTNAYDAFVVKYNSSYQLQWFKTFGDSNTPKGWDKARGIATDASGHVYVVGEFTWITDFDPLNPGTHTLTSDLSAQTPSGFIAKWDASGAFGWVKKVGNTNSGVATNFASVSFSGVYLQNDHLYTALEGYGYWDVDPSAGVKIIEVGGVANLGIGFGKYSLTGDYVDVFSIDTTFTGSGITLSGFGILGSDRWLAAGKFSKLIDFDPGANTKLLQTDITGPFHSFDQDLYVAKYTFGGSIGITSKSEGLTLSANPNPFSDHIALSGGADFTEYKIRLMDIQGRLMDLETGANGYLNTGSMPPGVYILEVQDKHGKVFRKKMIKNR